MASDRDGLGWHLAVRYYDPWREAVDERCDERFRCELTNFGPPGRETANYFYWMATLRELGHEAVMNIMIALVVSYVVLVMVTRNVLVPALSILSIGSTVTCVLAAIFLHPNEYKFDANAAILIVMATGMSVDYAVHLGHFYNDQPGMRFEKAQMALHGVGLSVCGGALTTGGAALPLTLAQHFLFFEEAGAFIFCTAFFGLFFSFAMLMPLLMIIGPEGSQGDLDDLFAKACSKTTPVRPAPTETTRAELTA